MQLNESRLQRICFRLFCYNSIYSKRMYVRGPEIVMENSVL